MMIPVRGYAAHKTGAPLVPFDFERREPGDRDVLIDILYCGVCHSDVHQVRNEWGNSKFPMVPGHEIAGRVQRVGKRVKRFKPGDAAGVGCFVDSCRRCANCKQGEEQFCAQQPVWTYNHTGPDGRPTYGGYSAQIVADENYVLKIASGLPLERVAPLLCAGITTYSPLRHWNAGKKTKVGVLGLGGLGHMAVKLAAAMGAEVTVISSSKAKEDDARRLGARRFALSSDAAAVDALKGRLDLIINTVSAPHDMNRALELLATNGSMVLVGVPPQPPEIQPFALIGGRRSLAGSLIGGIRQTQEMLDYCAKKKILSDVEVIRMADINKAYDRIVQGDVRYRFVIDLKTL